MRTDKQVNLFLVIVANLVLPLIFAVLLLLTFPELLIQKPLSFLLLIVAFFCCLICATVLVIGIAVQYMQRFYALSAEEAQQLMFGFVGGLPLEPPYGPLLRVESGRADPDGPAVLYKVGGPGFLSVNHDSVVVTQRFGRLHRILGPEFYRLEPFEKVWDVVDLRPQERKIKINFMTRDGIPASCEGTISFRVQPGDKPQRSDDSERAGPYPYTYSDDAILKLVTDFKRAKHIGGKFIIENWTDRITGGALDGEMRNELERYYLDDFLDPLAHNGEALSITPSGEKKRTVKSLAEIQERIEERVQKAGAKVGILVEEVTLGPVRPTEEAIPQQWLEFWQTELQAMVDAKQIEGEARYTEIVMNARQHAKVELVTAMLDEVQRMSRNGVEIPSEMVIMSFLDVMRSLADRDPKAAEKVFEEADKLQQILNAIQDQYPKFIGGPTDDYYTESAKDF